MANILDLPKDIIVIIFGHLTQKYLHYTISKVCKEWEKICQNQQFWKTFDGTLSSDDLYQYCKKGYLRKTVKMTYSPINTLRRTKKLEKIFAGMPSLREIDFSYVTYVEQKVLLCLHDKCKNLSVLKFSDNEAIEHYSERQPIRFMISNTLLENFLTLHGPYLTFLDLSFFKLEQPGQILLGVFNACPNLEGLCLKEVDARYNSYFVFPLVELQYLCKNIQVLVLSCNSLIPELTESSISIGFPLLKKFSYACRYESQFTDRHLNNILSNSPLLQLLDIEGQNAISKSAILSLPTNNLKFLHLAKTRLNLQDISCILIRWKETLTTVDISFLKSGCINTVLRQITTGNQMCALKRLILHGTKINSQTVIHLIENCRNLCQLNLQSCDKLDRENQRVFLNGFELLKLKENLFGR